VEEPEDAASVKSWPVPLRATLCGVSGALAVMVSVPMRVLPAVGAKVTPTAQVPLGVTVAPVQVSALLAKSLAFAPPIVTLEIVRFAVPVLVTVSI